MKKKLICIVGPTAVGKTDIALEIGKKIGAELISCDSRQVYKGLDIGTGKLPGGEVGFERHEKYWEIDGVKVWMYDVCEAQQRYDVWQYVQDVGLILDDIEDRNSVPIFVGGTGLYLRGILDGFAHMEIPVDHSLREELETFSLENLQKRLAELNDEQFQMMNNSEKNNKRRLIRKIEIQILRDKPRNQTFVTGIKNEYEILKIGICAPRELLYQRIDERVVRRVEAGMIEEAEYIVKKMGVSIDRLRELGLEYGMLADYLEGKFGSKGEFIEKLQFKIHQYAKRQLTWFQKEKDILWFDITKPDFKRKVEDYVFAWYNE